LEYKVRSGRDYWVGRVKGENDEKELAGDMTEIELNP
jgi:hypothetical protein